MCSLNDFIIDSAVTVVEPVAIAIIWVNFYDRKFITLIRILLMDKDLREFGKMKFKLEINAESAIIQEKKKVGVWKLIYITIFISRISPWKNVSE